MFKKIHNTTKIESKKNILISPLSVYQIISLLSNGAKGKTQEEILQTLLIDENISDKTLDKLNSNNENIIKDVKNSGKIKIANAILSKIELLNSFINIGKKYDSYIAKLEGVEQVNDWCRKHTNGKITKLIDSLSPDIQIVLLNAIYFYSDWKNEFEKEYTKKKNFKNADKSISQVDMMYQTLKYINYYEDETIQMIELPYKDNNNLSMIIILPREDKYSSSYDYLNKENIDFTKLVNNLSKVEEVYFHFPRFEFEYSIELKDVLKNINMVSAFTTNADFSNINSTISLYVSEIIQRTYIKVTETGTEAAAVTGVIIAPTSLPPPEITYDMNVNHSFIYMIRDKSIKDVDNNELMLFIGSCNDFSNQNGGFKYFNIQEDDYDNILIIDETRYIENNLKFILMFIIIILF
jgi:serpin B